MDFQKINNIYFIGIGGIGVSALARIFLSQKKSVHGSDLRDSATVSELKALGAQINIGHNISNVENFNADLVIYSEDISPDSAGFVELKYLKDIKTPELTYAQALGLMMSGHFGIAVTGTNGKSTTSAMLGLILDQADLDPTVVIGSKISQQNSTEKFKANARVGNGKYFVAEADEYHRHMLEINPNVIVVTNIAEDHLDYYRDLTEIKSVFGEFVAKLPADGVVIYNADDHNTVDVCKHAHSHKLTFGIDHYADLQALNIKTGSGVQTFDLHYKDELIGSCRLSSPGKFNIYNALGAALTAIYLGVPIQKTLTTFADFKGVWRRFEKVGELQGKPIISDYAHHPAGVSGTISAASQFFPGKKILTVFQPHHRNRTKRLFGEFVESLVKSEDLIVVEIFDVAGREHGEDVSSKQIVDELHKLNVKAVYAKDLEEAERIIREKITSTDAAVMMGAGDIDLLARKLVQG